MYGLAALLDVVVYYTTTEPKMVRNFLIACAVGDVGHLAVTYHVMGHRDFFNVTAWNSMAWGSVGGTIALLLLRVGYLMGWLGEDRRAS